MMNLWPQPYSQKPGAHEKDILENFLHRTVCGGVMTLEEAQRKIATDWYKAYEEMRGKEPSGPVGAGEINARAIEGLGDG